jgi:hypothetical protein
VANFDTATVHLEPDWDTNGTWVSGTISWALTLTDGAGNATDLAPNGWGVSVLSGSIGDSDLEIQLDAPAGLKGSTRYDIVGTFSHGTTGNPRYQKDFNFSLTDLNFANEPRADIIYDPRADNFISAVLEPTGVQLYRFRHDMGDKEELAFVQYGYYPSLWFDESGLLWMHLAEITDPVTVAVTWHLYKSTDGGATLIEQSAQEWTTEVVTQSFGNNVLIGYLGKGILLATARIGAVLLSARSFDNGLTWEERETVSLPGGSTVLPFDAPQMMPATGRTAMFEGWVRYSDDLGSTWPQYSVVPHSFVTPRVGYGAGGLILVCGRKTATQTQAAFFSAYTPGYSVSPADWSSVSDIDTVSDRSQLKPMQALNGSIYATNGRDKLYRSYDLGRNWEALP